MREREARASGKKDSGQATETKEARRARIAAIKAKVKAGTYTVDAAEVSRNIVDAHLTKKAGS